MQIFNNVPLSREFSYPEESTIRRYYIETCSVSRRPNLENYIQDGVDPYKFYSVVRRNYSSVDLPFVVPKIFSQFTTNVGLFSTVDDGSRDYFDRGVTSTDDGEFLEDTAFPLQPNSPPVRHSVSPRRTKKVLETQPSDDHDTSNFFEQPFQDNLDYDSETNLEHVRSQSRKESLLRLSDKSSFKSKSPNKLSRSLSRSSRQFESPLLGSSRTVLEIEDLKSSRGSEKSKKALRASSTSNLLYKLDRKGVVGPRRVMGSKISQKESQQALKVTKKGPYQIVRGPRKLVGVQKPLGLPDVKSKEDRKQLILQKKEELALLEDSRDYSDYDMGGFDSLDEDQQELKRLKRGSVVRRKPRPSVSSSGFLNSMYITERSASDEKDFVYMGEHRSVSNRYPRRIRRPVSPYWISNMASNGSSVVFLAGVCTQDSSRSNYLNDVMVPDSSLVLTNDHGDVKLQVVNKDSDDPEQKYLSDYIRNIAQVKNTPKRLADQRRRLVKPRRESDDSDREIEGREMLRLEDSRKDDYLKDDDDELFDREDRYRDDEEEEEEEDHVDDEEDEDGFNTFAERKRKNKLSEKEKEKENKMKKKRSYKKRVVKKRNDLTWEEAMAILEQEKSDEELEPFGLENRKKKRGVGRPRKGDEKKEEKNWEKFHSENLKEEDKLDSFVEEQSDVFYYKTMYVQDEQISLYEDGVRFTPMIMNSQCRTSEILIPAGQTLDFGNLNSNFICGYVYSGSEIEIKSEGEERTVHQNDLFFLPSFKECSIVNKNSDSDAHITFTFVNI